MAKGGRWREGYAFYDWSDKPKKAKAKAAKRLAKAAEEANVLKRRELDIRERECELSKE